MDPVTYILERGASAERTASYVEDVFAIYGYSGVNSSQTINNGLDFVNGQGLLWTKNILNIWGGIPSSEPHILIDTVRGNTQFLSTNVNSGQVSLNSIGGSPVTFTTSGYELVSGGLVRLNYWSTVQNSGNSYVSYAFKKASKFFDVVTYTGNGTTQVIPHSLNATPGFITVKNIGASGDWMCWHQGMVSGNRYILLNDSGRTSTGTGVWPWNNQTPTTTGFSVGFSGFTITGQSTNTSGNVYVAYIFADDAGGFGDSGNESIVKCGTYTGDGQSNFAVNIGWEPQFLMIKCIDPGNAANNSSWVIYDNVNGFYINPNVYVASITANATGVSQINNSVYPVSSGFIIATTGVSVNTAGVRFGYVAIRRGLMKTPTDVTTVFDPELQASGTSIANKFFSCDVDMLLALPRSTTTTGVNALHSRLAGPGYPIAPNAIFSAFNEQAAYGTPVSALSFRIKKGLVIASDESQRIQRAPGSGWVHYAFTRARRFFDMAAYIGDATTPRTIAHNLGVKPELIISKGISANTSWAVYASLLTAASGLLLNTADPALIGTPYWAGIEPTDTTFTIGSGVEVNNSTTIYVNYLFASCPGISQIGTYTGNATTNQINCGFTNGAKFVLIKRLDSVGDWFVWDTARGIGTGTDPYSRLNFGSGEITNSDFIDPFVSGFEISNTAPSGINASGGTYLFFAIT